MARSRALAAVIVLGSLGPLASLPARAGIERPGLGGITTILSLPGWWHAGSNPGGFAVDIDRTVSHGGRASARLQSIGPSPTGFGSLMQVADADHYRGKRVRLSAWVRAENVLGRHAGLWMRVDGPSGDPRKALAFDAMNDRAIVGTRDWQRYEIVLDVANDAVDIAFGAHLSGSGTIWVDDVELEEVGGDAADSHGPALAPGPLNLSFEGRL
jgi:hypothetical protein